jgi:hypothetical protein
MDDEQIVLEARKYSIGQGHSDYDERMYAKGYIHGATASRSENERLQQIIKVKDELYYKCEQLQVDKAELLKCLENIVMCLPAEGWESTRYYICSLITKHNGSI